MTKHETVRVSIGIFAWNEEDAVATTLESLFKQSFFSRIKFCEVVCVLNGCTDRTAEVAAAVFSGLRRDSPAAANFSLRVENLAEKGKMNAWNQFVHSMSAPQAEILVMMDADILIHRPDTIWNMVMTLEQNSDADVAVDIPCKNIPGAGAVRGSISGGMTRMTQASEAQLCGQLYAIRAATARRIYLPKDLSACEDGFLKAMVCTDLLVHEVWAKRICLAPDAGHLFEAYTSPRAVLKNQKRQVIGQTIVHLLVDKYLPTLSPAQRQSLAPLLRSKDLTDRDWLKRLIHEYVRGVRFCWQLYPGLLRQPLTRWARLPLRRRLSCLPAAGLGVLVSLISSFTAFRSLKAGSVSYWPKAERVGFKQTAKLQPMS